MKILVYTITRANTTSRGRLLNSTLTTGRETAGCQFHWHVYVNGKGILAESLIEAAHSTGVIDSFEVLPINVGQHPPVNSAIAKAIEEGYDYLVRTDDDVEWLSKRWLAKLVEAAEKIGDPMILSPVVKGLQWQPPQSPITEVNTIPLKFVEGPIGGICRLTPVSILKEKPYISDVRLPMGGGDAGGVGKWAMEDRPVIPMAYCQHIRIRHAKSTLVQEAEDPAHFSSHHLLQGMPYIPAWKEV